MGNSCMTHYRRHRFCEYIYIIGRSCFRYQLEFWHYTGYLLRIGRVETLAICISQCRRSHPRYRPTRGPSHNRLSLSDTDFPDECRESNIIRSPYCCSHSPDQYFMTNKCLHRQWLVLWCNRWCNGYLYQDDDSLFTCQ